MSRLSEQPSESEHAHPHFDADVSGAGRVYQAGRDQHFYYQDGVQRRRSAHAGQVVDQCPYPGLAAFGPEQARWFFGRDRLLAELSARLDDRARHGGLLMIVAPSGAGKSSLLQAGLIPALDDGAVPGSRHWPRLLFTPTAHPMAILTANLAACAGVGPEQAREALVADIGQYTAMMRQALTADQDTSGIRVVMIIDQLEELFTQCTDESERRRFVEVISHLADVGPDGQPPVALVVCGLRSDFYTHCADHARLRAALQDGQLYVGPMSQNELREAILYPAQDMGLDIEPGLVELLLSDLGATTADGYEAGRLPLLAHALRTTWQQRHGHTLTVDGYRVTGGIQQAVATTAEHIFTCLEPVDQQTARTLFLRLVTIGDSDQGARRRVAQTDLTRVGFNTGSAVMVINAFTQGRLLTQSQDSVEISHEALLSAWPRLQGWIDDDRAGLLIRQHLIDAAAAWCKDGRDPSGLYRGTRLAIARDWAVSGASPGGMDAVTAEFLQASLRLEEHERLTVRRRTRRLRMLAGALALLLVAALAAAGAAFNQRQIAIANSQVAGSRELAAKSALADRPEAGMILAAAAFGQADTVEARSALLSAGSRYFAGELTGTDQLIVSMAYAPDGRTIAASTMDAGGANQFEVRPLRASIIRWDTADPRRRVHIPLPQGWGMTSIVFSPDGRLLATVESNSERISVTLRDPVTLKSIATLDNRRASNSSAILHAAFSRDGRIIAVSGSHAVRLWDVHTRTLLATVSTGKTDRTAFDLKPDGRQLAIGEEDGRVRLWNVATRRTTEFLKGQDPARIVRFSPDGRVVATLSGDTVQLWDTSTHREISTQRVAGLLNDLAFSPDGTMVAAAGNSGVQVWDVYSGIELALLTGHYGGGVSAVAFGPQGRLASGGYEGSVRLWDMGRSVLVAHPASAVASIAYSRRGRSLITGSFDGSVRMWNIPTQTSSLLFGRGSLNDSDPTEIALNPDETILAASIGQDVRLWDIVHNRLITTLIPPQPSPTVTGLAFSPDGRTLVTVTGDLTVGGSGKGQLRLWDVRSGHLIATVTPSIPGYTTESFLAVAFSPDGRTLATGHDSGFIRLWDVTSRRAIAALWHGRGSVPMVSFSPDGRTIATGGVDRTVRLWDTASRRQIAALPGPDVIRRFAFSPDGQTLAAGGFDGSVRLWNMATRRLIAVLSSPEYIAKSISELPITSVAFSPDGRTLAAGRTNGTILHWDLDPDHVITTICKLIQRSYQPDDLMRIAPETLGRGACL